MFQQENDHIDAVKQMDKEGKQKSFWNVLSKAPTSTVMKICPRLINTSKPTSSNELFQSCQEEWSNIQP